MTRDYSQLFPSATPATAPSALARLGWQPFFAAQIDADTLTATPPVRVTAVHRSGLRVTGDGIEAELPPDEAVTVGDWLLYDADHPADSVLLERKSVIRRRAAGREAKVQLIAANIDTVFIVSSCNADFNVARLERYVALAFEAEVDPVILLTKADLAADPQDFVTQAQAISSRVPVIALDARGEAPRTALAQWAKPGRTVAFLGSSGVGKSTLTNALADTELDTQGVREDDAKGRHTTRHRQLYLTDTGPAVLDTPGMRELQLTDVAAGLSELFDDIEDLATRCKFRNCAHEGEPDCAVQAAIAAGELDPVRLTRFRKLAAEEAHNTATVAQKRAREKGFAKHVKRVTREKPNRR
ncbi:ribosome small subunit-dependent GTPase A [Maritimibacter sp. UBA3975]|uniref:ribosome small subunit-dependent GTPase A n=1 Tax=Maritimibacter sp. UBA3975 TaxID=1946833 RepID=UPI000C0985B5|nr:ribosome small subunit-dependent GTPase A [Maritimibacter sp. UBA3975]MAM62631.1 ribosome small subunit-dependent GTPase A [Maritimibacter sp.]|tara:strand:+ start:12592 stop:13659 length:1068 start_codon:yes stop_codon:yes gene_type:complete